MGSDATGDGEFLDSEVMGSVDSSGPVSRYVIADTTKDDAWLSIQASEAPDLGDWR